MHLVTSLAVGSVLAAPLLAQHRICTVDGSVRDEYLGCAVSSAGDVDRDGYPDLLVGAVRGSGTPGRVVVFSGRDGRQLLRLTGAGADETLGFAVAAAGDLDRDGHADILVGAPEDCG